MALSVDKLKALWAKDGGGKVLWDFCTKCSASCKLAADCPYEKKGFCKVEIKYLRTISEPVFSLLKDPDSEVKLSEFEWLDFGLLLIPLYHDLIKVKKEITYLTDILVTSPTGATKVHPLFQEKRRIIKAIEDLEITKTLRDKFDELGVPRDAKPKGEEDGQEELSDEYLEEHGTPGFAERLAGDVEGEALAKKKAGLR